MRMMLILALCVILLPVVALPQSPTAMMESDPTTYPVVDYSTPDNFALVGDGEPVHFMKNADGTISVAVFYPGYTDAVTSNDISAYYLGGVRGNCHTGDPSLPGAPGTVIKPGVVKFTIMPCGVGRFYLPCETKAGKRVWGWLDQSAPYYRDGEKNGYCFVYVDGQVRIDLAELSKK